MENLTSRVLAYQRSRSGLEGLVAEIAPRVLRYPRRRFGWDDDACSEFYLYFHPRLLRLLGRFHDQGKPFETYLSSVLQWQTISFSRRRRKIEQAWAMGARLAAEAAPDPEEAPEPARFVVPRTPPGWTPSPRHGDSDRRSLLFLVLKCCRRLDPDDLPAAAKATGVAADRLIGLVDQLRAGMEPVEQRLAMLRKRRNRAFSEARLLETELAGGPDPVAAERLRLRLDAANRRMNAAVARMARVRCDPTNREVARVLGVPKGTVDSGLFWLKRRLGAGYDPDRERSA
jgi:DNA-directed RNA polymerase specialized sigma24 family protein